MTESKDIWTVSRLNQAAQQVLEKGLPRLWLEGELSNFKCYRSGHWYFRLKDEHSQIQAVMFRGNNRQVTFQPKDGQQLRVHGDVTLYPANGSYQIMVRDMQPAGRGDLLLRLEQLKQKLNAEGLFNADKKRPLPAFPKCLGVITSASGAAFHDILRVLKRRYPQLPVILYPASVQGERAPAELVNALQLAITRQECDVLIIGRGGGSLEDLLAFSDETVTRAVASCPIPIVSAVGHEVDFSLTDFAADMRAATPSHAAELIAPDRTDIERRLQHYQRQLKQALQHRLQAQATQLEQLQKRLISPERLRQQHELRIDELCLRLNRAATRHLDNTRNRLEQLQKRLTSPARLVAQQSQHAQTLKTRLLNSQRHIFEEHLTRYRYLHHRLTMAGPDNLLQRGYSITLTANDGKVVRAGDVVKPGTRLVTRLADQHTLHSEVVAGNA